MSLDIDAESSLAQCVCLLRSCVVRSWRVTNKILTEVGQGVSWRKRRARDCH